MKDLIVLCPDICWRATLDALLSRHEALGLPRPLLFEVVNPPGARDGGVRADAAKILRYKAEEFRHALVVLDWLGCGDPRPASVIQEELGQGLAADWEDRAAAVVVEPELEAWILGGFSHFKVLSPRADVDVRGWMVTNGLWEEQAEKPADPKRAIEQFFRVHRVAPAITSANYRKIMEKVSLRLDRCRCASFHRFVHLCHGWFKEDD